MGRRKVNQTELLKLIEEGKLTQREIAVLFQVSPAAVTKLKKKIMRNRLPQSVALLTPKEQNYCIAVASGQSRTAAALNAFDCSSRESAKALQNQLSQNPKIELGIKDLLEQSGGGRVFRASNLTRFMNSTDHHLALAATVQTCKIAGDDQQAKQQTVEKPSFTVVDLIPFRNPASFDRSEGQCTICKVEASEVFCNLCCEKYPVLIDKIKRHWKGDKCALCQDDRRCFAFCKECKESKTTVNHDEKIAET